MPRPPRLSAEEEKDLKFWLLFGIEAMECKNAKELAEFEGGKYKPLQIQYYLNKFNLSFKKPYAFNTDLIAYETWCDEQEAKGAWLGDKTTLQAIIEREADLADLIKAGNPNVESFADMIEAAKRNPAIKTLGDWESLSKNVKDGELA